MAQEVGRVLNRDPERLQFFKATPYRGDGPGQPVKSTESRIIEEIIYIVDSVNSKTQNVLNAIKRVI